MLKFFHHKKAPVQGQVLQSILALKLHATQVLNQHQIHF